MSGKQISVGSLVSYRPSLNAYTGNNTEPSIFLVLKVTSRVYSPLVFVDVQKLGQTHVLKDVESRVFEVVSESR
jgi:hypothetical protein